MEVHILKSAHFRVTLYTIIQEAETFTQKYSLFVDFVHDHSGGRDLLAYLRVREVLSREVG